MAKTSVVLHGMLGGQGTSLDELLAVVGMSRQWMEVVLGDEAPQGRILCKSGQVVRAFAPPDREGLDAFLALYRTPGRTFTVFRGREPGEEGAPIGAVAQLVARAQEVPPTLESPEPPRTVLLEGSFEHTPLAEVLSVLALTRQRVELVVRDGAGMRGAIVLKAGRVLEARTVRPRATGRAAFAGILRDPGSSFTVVRCRAPSTGEPLGTVEALLADPGSERRVGDTGTIRELVLEGSFAEASVVELFGMLSLSRQHLVVLFRAARKGRARLVLKAGRVLEAEHGALRGPSAVRAMLEEPGEAFVVYRIPDAGALPPPIGGLLELVSAAAAEPADDDPPTVVLVAPRVEEAPTMHGGPATAAADGPDPALEARLRELEVAVASLRRALSARPPARPDASWFVGMVALNAVALGLAVALVVHVLRGG